MKILTDEPLEDISPITFWGHNLVHNLKFRRLYAGIANEWEIEYTDGVICSNTELKNVYFSVTVLYMSAS
jgi:hypothetical protein